ncbi:aarF domain-containing protein kinase 1 [Platysternon megacephalum]|uniref:AarF domain-containing protein kinase 1 n=1 Tax=Platysternon megacephalum TaxID=55544 RepID=A0A4D9F378_9SAUR|nr:aarF domain-containing protein kinase 1 [Platysternon megacephalum]
MPCGARPYHMRGGGLCFLLVKASMCWEVVVASMARRALKLVSLAAASSGLCLYSSKYLDPNDFGAVRVSRAIATTAVITYDYLTSLRSVPYGSQEYAYLKSQVHLRSAERLRDLCCANRGTFIKVGQHLGALDYLLPEEYTRTLKVLHSQAPQSSMQEIEQVIREDLGKEGSHDQTQKYSYYKNGMHQRGKIGLQKGSDSLMGSIVDGIPNGLLQLCRAPAGSQERKEEAIGLIHTDWCRGVHIAQTLSRQVRIPPRVGCMAFALLPSPGFPL